MEGRTLRSSRQGICLPRNVIPSEARNLALRRQNRRTMIRARFLASLGMTAYFTAGAVTIPYAQTRCGGHFESFGRKGREPDALRSSPTDLCLGQVCEEWNLDGDTAYPLRPCACTISSTTPFTIQPKVLRHAPCSYKELRSILPLASTKVTSQRSTITGFSGESSFTARQLRSSSSTQGPASFPSTFSVAVFVVLCIVIFSMNHSLLPWRYSGKSYRKSRFACRHERTSICGPPVAIKVAVILSEAKDLQLLTFERIMQMLRFAQHDTSTPPQPAKARRSIRGASLRHPSPRKTAGWRHPNRHPVP